MANRKQRNIESSDIIAKLDQLCAESKNYEGNELLRSNQRLYELLSEALDLYYKARGSESLLRETLKSIKQRLAERDIRVQRNSVALTLFVRYMFNSDRQRALNYSRALQAAVQANIPPKDFARFVDDHGGIEECKRRFVLSEESRSRRLAIQEAIAKVESEIRHLKKSPIATLNVDSEDVSDHCEVGLMFIAAEAQKSGKVKALYVVPAYSKFVERWAKQALAKKYANIADVNKKRELKAEASRKLEAAVASTSTRNNSTELRLRKAA